MKQRIAILSDIHGNTTALEAFKAVGETNIKSFLNNTGFWVIFFFLDRVEMI